jgi:hypothetical protein
VNALKRICRVLAVIGIFTVLAPAMIPGDRVQAVCVEAGDIRWCAPHDVV